LGEHLLPNVSGFVILHPLPYLPFRVFFFSPSIQNTRKVTEEGYFRRWQRLGTWREIHDRMRRQVRHQAGKAENPSAAIADSQSVKTTEKRGRSAALMVAKRSKDANAM